MSKLRRWMAYWSPWCYCGDPMYCCGICPAHPLADLHVRDQGGGNDEEL